MTGVTRGKTCAELNHNDSPTMQEIENDLRIAEYELEIATSAMQLATAKLAKNVRLMREIREQA